MQKIKLVRLAATLLLATCGIAHASTGTFDDLDKLQKERFYYQAQAAANAAKKAANAESDTEVAQVNTVGNQANQRGSETLPSLVKINGRKAVIVLSDGTSRTVMAGQMLPGGNYQVVSVTLNGVSVKRITDGKIFPLN
ncbi:hypothetical protein BL250_12345 [Erwinia sp. OLTSP20]|uniref:type IV pilus biogenesis protein PilP n=1 Tax=Enterobacterales TaxID=91347 RepID=UPI000C187D33|nr:MULTISPECIES: type IV pilus biogenesis protein PilP [Enterobacterales]PII85118.1 hypothetical protein BMF91_23870 [Serratia sp. OLFL2]PIJ49378.1 hypothetical protein BV501_13165 [Erwinia sp. OAMSP11]PIJ69735.1 hypothetical protein BK416_13770 [Erwinia sp. OLSSP12]PIJ76219.1 hypothetical protein BLD47_18025 [Erwinia sp. OLCASP19]PIJ76740.1 hypothetical protein BLD46_18250 [Erwinia sp. OLMTSP26]